MRICLDPDHLMKSLTLAALLASTLLAPVQAAPSIAPIATEDRPKAVGNQSLRAADGPFEITLTAPVSVQPGAAFDLTIQITNPLKSSQVFHSVDIYRTFFDGFELAGSSMPVEATDYESFHSLAPTNPPTIEPGQTSTLTLTFKARRAGTYTGGFDVCEPGQTFTTLSPTVVVGDGDADIRTIAGALDQGDDTLNSGEFRDIHTIPVVAGQQITIDLLAADFDPYLVAIIPGQPHRENDDHEGSLDHSRLTFTASETGDATIVVTSAEPKETGGYTLTITTGGGGGDGGGQARTLAGALAKDDDTLESGEFRDLHKVPVEAGQRVSIDLRSSDFDPYLIVVIPGQDNRENDDHEGSLEHAHVTFTASEAGEIAIIVTSARANETGDYALTVTTDADALTSTGPALNTITGTLASGDATLSSGEYADFHQFEAIAGQPLVIDLRSDDFDPYLIVIPPSRDQLENDDFNGDDSRSRVEFDAAVAGTYRIVVTTNTVGEIGTYSLALPADPHASAATGDGVSAGLRRERGQLEPSDPTLDTGEYQDVYTFTGKRGETVVINLRSEGFDPYLMLRGPGEFSRDNDDHEGSSSWSQIVAELPVSGEFRVVVTTYKPGSTGSYELVISRPGQGETPVAAAPIEGTLASGDTVLSEGEYADLYPLHLVPGSRVTIDLVSNDFDTYLALVSPSGEIVRNDDFGDDTDRSRIDHDVSEAGEYTVYVTSYRAGESGTYTLNITSEASAPDARADGDLASISFGQNRDGNLAESDLKLDTGEYYDIFAFEGEAGQSVTINMRSDAFDTYLILSSPGGVKIQNDDHENSSSHSRIEMTLAETGRYRIYATSYQPGKSGNYSVSLARLDSATARPDNLASGSGGNIHGLFVGISEYDRMSSLEYTDEDARRIFTALRDGAGMPEGQGTLLIDSEATRANFTAAIKRLADTTDADDTVILFFSGHGDRYPQPDGTSPREADGKTETIELFDEAITDEELNELLNSIDCGIQLIVVDSCFSGGLSKNIISRPGRMGLFSSLEDVTSLVPDEDKFLAGGYLSVFFYEALIEPRADSDGNGEISAIELSHYISEQYRSHVKSATTKGNGNGIDYISPQDNLGYQTLVTDRGSILPNTPLFRRR
jgi:hypothetical protein